jgi:hypothetical protein
MTYSFENFASDGKVEERVNYRFFYLNSYRTQIYMNYFLGNSQNAKIEPDKIILSLDSSSNLPFVFRHCLFLFFSFNLCMTL